MSKAVDLREDFDADTLRRLARKSRDAGQSRRLLALAAICLLYPSPSPRDSLTSRMPSSA